MKHADTPVDYENSFKNHDLQGPLLWESDRAEEDKCFVETSKSFGLLNCHANMHLLTSSDQSGPVEEYLCEHLTKTLAAMTDIQEVKSRSSDAGTQLRNSDFFAEINMNVFYGGSEIT